MTVDKLEIAKKKKKKSTEKIGIFYLNCVENFDKFFVNVGSKLSSQIPKSTTEFSSYFLKNWYHFSTAGLAEEEFKRTFISLGNNKSLGGLIA